MASTAVTAVVIDDHPFYRDGLVRGLTQRATVRVVGEAGGGREGLELIRRERPQVALVDYQMPDLDGLAVLQAVARDGLPTRVLLLSAVTESTVVYKALELGAAGYLPKDAHRRDIVEAVARVARGETMVPPELAAELVGEIRLRSHPSQPVLSDRERQVLDGFARGLSIPQVAAELIIGSSTVKTHAQHLYEKLGVSDRAAAVAEAMRRGLLE